MFEEYKVTRELRKLKDADKSKRAEFLASLRLKLEDHIEKNPVREIKRSDFLSVERFKNPLLGTYSFFEKFKIMPKLALASFLGILALGLSGISMAAQISLPGEPLYPIKTFTENIRYSLSVSSESRAKINLVFANERVGEIKQLLEKKGVEPQGLDIALLRLSENVQRAAEIVRQEKETGKDISEFAKDTHDSMKQYRENLKRTFEEQDDILEAEKYELKTKIKDAGKNNDAANKEALRKKLESIILQKKLLESKKEESEKNIKRQMESVKKELKEEEKKSEAIKDLQEKINELKKEIAELTDKIAKENIIIPSDSFAALDTLMAKTEAAFDKGDYPSAEQYSSETEKALKNIEALMEQAEEAGNNEHDANRGKKDIKKDNGENSEGKNTSSYYEKQRKAENKSVEIRTGEENMAEEENN